MDIEIWLKKLNTWNSNLIAPIVCKKNFSGKAIVFLGGGRWQMSGIFAAKKLGLTVILVDSSESSPGVQYADHVLIRKDFETAYILQYLSHLSLKIVGIVAIVSDIGQMPAAKLRAALGLGGLQPEQVKAFVEKSKQRELWDLASLPNPRWQSFNNVNEATEYLQNTIHFPLIVKPTDNAGSRGITVLKNRSNIDAALNNAFRMSNSKHIIIEEYINGIEFAIETFSIKGEAFILAISQKNKVPGTDSTVASELFTPNYANHALDQIISLVKKALIALNYQNGPAHTEILLTPSGELFLVETGARGGGFMVADGIVPVASCFDLATATVLSTVGVDFNFQLPKTLRSFILRFIPSQSGIVKSYSGFDELDKHQNIFTAPMVEIGKQYSHPRCDGDRVCYILTYGNSYEEAKWHADHSEKIIKFYYE